MSKKLQLTYKGADESKTFTIPNPDPEFKVSAANSLATTYNVVYNTDLALSKAQFIETSETVVYPAA